MKRTIIEGPAQSGPIHHTASDGRPWAVFTVDCGSWVRVVAFGDVADRLRSASFGRGVAVRCTGRISVRVSDSHRYGQQAALELIAEDVTPLADNGKDVLR